VSSINSANLYTLNKPPVSDDMRVFRRRKFDIALAMKKPTSIEKRVVVDERILEESKSNIGLKYATKMVRKINTIVPNTIFSDNFILLYNF